MRHEPDPDTDIMAHRIDEGLVQSDSPFLASKQFGITYVTGRGNVAEIGTLMEIVDFAPIGSEGRLFLNNKGTRLPAPQTAWHAVKPLQHHCFASVGFQTFTVDAAIIVAALHWWIIPASC